ncbi:hypothetical protein Tco_0359995 [Tanacetum coccineum]
MRSVRNLQFSDGTLTRLLSSLEDITKNIDMEYLPKRRWSNLEKKRAHFMIKDINKLLKERRMMRSLEKFVGGRLYRTDLRLLFDTPAGNPVKKILLELNLSDHRKGIFNAKVTLLKDDFKKEESRNIDREIALEKRIKQLDNIIFKRDQSAQIVHMLMKPQFFYDHTTKQALGFQNPFYLKKAQQLEPKLYDGNVIKNTNAIVIPDSGETLLLAEESRSKMLLKQQDPLMLEKKVNTTPVDYAILNQLSQDFETQLVPQTELSAEQAFWSKNSVNSPEPTLSSRPTKVEVPKELSKVSMVNTSLKKLKYHLAGFDVVVKVRTTPTTITEGLWGFEHTKACFRDEIIPFVKALKDLFNTFNQYLIDELFEVQNVFHLMEQAVEQHRLESKTFEVKMNQVLNGNE